MIAKPESAAAPSRRTVRLAWWVAFVLTIALLAGLGLARSAHATAPARAVRPDLSIPPPFEAEEECEADEPSCEEELSVEECEEGEEECEGLEEGGEEAPAECLLTAAQPRVVVSSEQRRLRLEVRYSLAGPADVLTSLRGSGGHGSVSLAAQKHHLSHSGSFEESAELSPAEATRALAANQFTVRLRVLGVPWSCHRHDFRHLSVKRQAHGGAVFSETVADRRADH